MEMRWFMKMILISALCVVYEVQGRPHNLETQYGITQDIETTSEINTHHGLQTDQSNGNLTNTTTTSGENPKSPTEQVNVPVTASNPDGDYQTPTPTNMKLIDLIKKSSSIVDNKSNAYEHNVTTLPPLIGNSSNHNDKNESYKNSQWEKDRNEKQDEKVTKYINNTVTNTQTTVIISTVTTSSDERNKSLKNAKSDSNKLHEHTSCFQGQFVYRNLSGVVNDDIITFSSCADNITNLSCVLANSLKVTANYAFRYYCLNNKDVAMDQNVTTTCEDYVKTLTSENEDVVLPDVSKPLGGNWENNMLEIYRGLVHYEKVLMDISALQIQEACRFHLSLDMPCDTSTICSLYQQKDQESCNLTKLVETSIHKMTNLRYQHEKRMKHYCITTSWDISTATANDTSIFCPTNGDSCGQKLVNYTLIGLYNAMLQGKITEEFLQSWVEVPVVETTTASDSSDVITLVTDRTDDSTTEPIVVSVPESDITKTNNIATQNNDITTAGETSRTLSTTEISSTGSLRTSHPKPIDEYVTSDPTGNDKTNALVTSDDDTKPAKTDRPVTSEPEENIETVEMETSHFFEVSTKAATVEESTTEVDEITEINDELYSLEWSMDITETNEVEDIVCSVDGTSVMYLNIIANWAKSVIDSSFEFYCTHSDIASYAGSNNNCEEYVNTIIAAESSTYLPSTSVPDSKTWQDDMQELNRGLISFKSVLTNVSDLQTTEICRGHYALEVSCSKNIICSPSSIVNPEDVFYCDFQKKLEEDIRQVDNLLYQHQRKMKDHKVIPVNTEESVNINAISCPRGTKCGETLIRYTLAGLYKTIAQLSVTEETYNEMHNSISNC